MGRGFFFYLDAADERKGLNEKMEMEMEGGMGEEKQEEKREEGVGRKTGCCFSVALPALHH